MSKQKQDVTDLRREVESFIRHVVAVSQDVLESNIPDTETRATLQEASSRLTRSTAELIKLIEGLPREADREHALYQLWDALAGAYLVGYGVTSEENAQAVQREQGRRARTGKAQRRGQDPINRIIDGVVNKHRHPGDAAHPYKAADSMVGEVQGVLAEHGHNLTVKQIRGRIARLLEKPARS